MDRREAIKWMLSATAAVAFLDRAALGEGALPPVKGATGYGNDPDMLRNYSPGELWLLVLTEAQQRTTAALCDLIIPEDAKSPSAATLGVPEFINEWVSAPYPGHDKDRVLIVDGLAWLEAEAERRFGNGFTALVWGQKSQICDDICYLPKAQPPFRSAAEFFRRFRNLTAGGFYTTAEGMKDLGYVGNVPLAAFAGPPPEALAKLGLS
jgi:hypothetical protein